jgi:hypothetical protein
MPRRKADWGTVLSRWHDNGGKGATCGATFTFCDPCNPLWPNVLWIRLPTPEEYTAAALPMIRRDARESFSKKTYAVAIRVADKVQKVQLKSEVQRLGVATKPQLRK